MLIYDADIWWWYMMMIYDDDIWWWYMMMIYDYDDDDDDDDDDIWYMIYEDDGDDDDDDAVHNAENSTKRNIKTKGWTLSRLPCFEHKPPEQRENVCRQWTACSLVKASSAGALESDWCTQSVGGCCAFLAVHILQPLLPPGIRIYKQNQINTRTTHMHVYIYI